MIPVLVVDPLWVLLVHLAIAIAATVAMMKKRDRAKPFLPALFFAAGISLIPVANICFLLVALLPEDKPNKA